MPRTGWSPSTIPYGADQTVYLVVDRFGSGSVYRETEIEHTDLDTIISDFMTGQFNDPVRVVAFNTIEHWADDVSKDVAQEIQARCDIAGEPVPEHVEDFVATYAGRMRQTGVATGLKRGRQLRRLYSPIRAKLNILDWRPGLYSEHDLQNESANP